MQRSLGLHDLDGLFGGPDRVGREAKVHERCGVTIAFLDLGRRRCIRYHGNLEPLLEQFAQV